MNKIWRLLWLRIRLLSRKRRQHDMWGIHYMPFKVWVRDLDLLCHVNNGKYLQLMDVARVHMMMHSGAWEAMAHRKWISVVSAETITFRRSLKIGQKFTIETQIIGWLGPNFVVEQRFVLGDEVVAQGFVLQIFVTRSGFVLSEDQVLEGLGRPEALPPIPGWVRKWAESSRLPRNHDHFPSRWREPEKKNLRLISTD